MAKYIVANSRAYTWRHRREMEDRNIIEDQQSAEGDSHSQLFTNRNSSRNGGPTEEHSKKAEEGWQIMAWAIYYPPVHWEKAL